MCREMDQIYKEGGMDKAEAMAVKMYKKGDSVESIADVAEVSVEQVKTWILSHGLKMRELETV